MFVYVCEYRGLLNVYTVCRHNPGVCGDGEIASLAVLSLSGREWQQIRIAKRVNLYLFIFTVPIEPPLKSDLDFQASVCDLKSGAVLLEIRQTSLYLRNKTQNKLYDKVAVFLVVSS